MNSKMNEEKLIDKSAEYPGEVILKANPKSGIPQGLRIHYNGYDDNPKRILHNFHKSFQYDPLLTFLYVAGKAKEYKSNLEEIIS